MAFEIITGIVLLTAASVGVFATNRRISRLEQNEMVECKTCKKLVRRRDTVTFVHTSYYYETPVTTRTTLCAKDSCVTGTPWDRRRNDTDVRGGNAQLRETQKKPKTKKDKA